MKKTAKKAKPKYQCKITGRGWVNFAEGCDSVEFDVTTFTSDDLSYDNMSKLVPKAFNPKAKTFLKKYGDPIFKCVAMSGKKEVWCCGVAHDGCLEGDDGGGWEAAMNDEEAVARARQALSPEYQQLLLDVANGKRDIPVKGKKAKTNPIQEKVAPPKIAKKSEVELEAMRESLRKAGVYPPKNKGSHN